MPTNSLAMLPGMRIYGTVPDVYSTEGSIVTTGNSFASAAKKATKVSLAESLLLEAKALRINVSQAAEAGLAKAVAEKRAELWLKENAKAFDCWSAYVESNGLPFEKYRGF